MHRAIFLISIVLFITAVALAQTTIDKVEDIFTELTMAQNDKGAAWLRMAHAKQHGCVTAVLNVNEDLDPGLAQGIFQPSVSYAAFIRFSNGVGRGFTPLLEPNETDSIPDIRGLAMKIVNATGPFLHGNSQVFTFTTSRVGFLDTLDHALSFFHAVKKGNAAVTLWLAEHPRLATLFAAQEVSGVITDVLSADWWGPAAQMHGSKAAKYRLYPCETSRLSNNKRGFNSLREQLEYDLSQEYACFTWAVQLWQDNHTTPIDDTTVQWNTPFYDLANLYIPEQKSWSPKQEEYCRWMSFNPGDSIQAHKPVGVIQDLRSVVYPAMASLRHKLKSQPDTDASYEDWLEFPSWT